MFKRWQEFHSRSSRSRVHVTTLPRCTKIEALHFEGRRVFWYHLDVLEVQGPRDDATACVCRSMRSRDARGPSKGKLIRKTDESDNGLRQATLKEQKRNVTTSTTLALSELTCSKARTFVIFIFLSFSHSFECKLNAALLVAYFQHTKIFLELLWEGTLSLPILGIKTTKISRNHVFVFLIIKVNLHEWAVWTSVQTLHWAPSLHFKHPSNQIFFSLKKSHWWHWNCSSPATNHRFRGKAVFLWWIFAKKKYPAIQSIPNFSFQLCSPAPESILVWKLKRYANLQMLPLMFCEGVARTEMAGDI